MAEMRDIPGTPSWIQAGAKTTPEQPAVTPAPEENKENTQTTE